MRYVPCWKQIGITQARYMELLNFCRQYPDWKAEANSLLGVRAIINDGMPHGNKKRDPVAAAAEKREKLLAKIAIVEECAKTIGDGEWYAAMIQHICYKKPNEHIDVALLPTSNRNDFYKQRRLFFELLDQKRD